MICFRRSGCHLNDVRSDSMIDRVDHRPSKGKRCKFSDFGPTLSNIVERITTYQTTDDMYQSTSSSTARLATQALSARSRTYATSPWASQQPVKGKRKIVLVGAGFVGECCDQPKTLLGSRLISFVLNVPNSMNRIVHRQSSRSGSKEPSRSRFP